MHAVYRKAKAEAGLQTRPSPCGRAARPRRGRKTARRLLAERNVSDGFTALWQAGRLDLTVEAQVLRPQQSELFTARSTNRTLSSRSARVAEHMTLMEAPSVTWSLEFTSARRIWIRLTARGRLGHLSALLAIDAPVAPHGEAQRQGAGVQVHPCLAEHPPHPRPGGQRLLRCRRGPSRRGLPTGQRGTSIPSCAIRLIDIEEAGQAPSENPRPGPSQSTKLAGHSITGPIVN